MHAQQSHHIPITLQSASHFCNNRRPSGALQHLHLPEHFQLYAIEEIWKNSISFSTKLLVCKLHRPLSHTSLYDTVVSDLQKLRRDTVSAGQRLSYGMGFAVRYLNSRCMLTGAYFVDAIVQYKAKSWTQSAVVESGVRTVGLLCPCKACISAGLGGTYRLCNNLRLSWPRTCA